MLRKIICLMLSVVLLCLCSCSSGSKGEDSSETEDLTVPNIVLPDLPAKVKAYGGTISVQSITIDKSYHEAHKSVSGSVSMRLDAAENGASSACKINFKVINENGVAVDTGFLGDSETKNLGDFYEGTFDITNVQAGKKYTLILLGD